MYLFYLGQGTTVSLARWVPKFLHRLGTPSLHIVDSMTCQLDGYSMLVRQHVVPWDVPSLATINNTAWLAAANSAVAPLRRNHCANHKKLQLAAAFMITSVQ